MKEQLEKIQHWHFVHNKKKVLERLRGAVDKMETVQDIIDGFLSGAEIARAGEGISGVLIALARGVIFVSNEKRDSTVKTIDAGDITAIDVERASSSVTLQIKSRGEVYSFRSFITAARARRFAEKVGVFEDQDAEAVSVGEDDPAAGGVARRYVEKDALPQFIEKITAAQKELARVMEKESRSDTVTSREEEIFSAARHIVNRIDECTGQIDDENLKENIIDDLIVLSSLAGVADGSLDEPELLLIALVLLPLSGGENDSWEKTGDDIRRASHFPHEKKKEILQYWDHASAMIKKRGLNERDELLPSLERIRVFDAAKGTLLFDTLSAAYTGYVQALMKADGSINDAERDRLKQINRLVAAAGEKPLPEVEKLPPEETLEEVMEKINELVGMENIKEEIQTFVNLVKIQKERRERGLPETPLSLHAVFYGPPGTGKTTIARLLGRVYRCLGLLKKGHLTETDRAGLVAGYVGQTATRTDEVVQKALDGVLFIDEAYALARGRGEQDFGQEAVDTILKRMEDHRDRLAVIVAGYPDEMKVFIESNPGLKSRFRRYYYFDHYEPDTLMAIFEIFSENVSFTVEEGAKAKLKEVLTAAYENRTRTFGNGRLVRNLFEKIVERQANRIAAITPLTEEILCTITADDVPEEIGNITYGFHK